MLVGRSHNSMPNIYIYLPKSVTRYILRNHKISVRNRCSQSSLCKEYLPPTLQKIFHMVDTSSFHTRYHLDPELMRTMHHLETQVATNGTSVTYLHQQLLAGNITRTVYTAKMRATLSQMAALTKRARRLDETVDSESRPATKRRTKEFVKTCMEQASAINQMREDIVNEHQRAENFKRTEESIERLQQQHSKEGLQKSVDCVTRLQEAINHCMKSAEKPEEIIRVTELQTKAQCILKYLTDFGSFLCK